MYLFRVHCSQNLEATEYSFLFYDIQLWRFAQSILRKVWSEKQNHATFYVHCLLKVIDMYIPYDFDFERSRVTD